MMDINLQKTDELTMQNDVTLMKVIHDMKNPLIACREAINDKE